MRRIILAGVATAFAVAPVHAQLTFSGGPNSDTESIAEKVAAERDLPVAVYEASSTDFQVSGYGYQEVDLPHPLTAGTWTATLSIRGDNSYSIWLKARVGGDLFELFCKNLLCSASDHPTRTRFRVNRPGRAYIDPITSTGTWTVRFVKDATTTPRPTPDPTPPPPTNDGPPCQTAGEGINLSGYQMFMCIVDGAGEVQQLEPHRLSSRSVLFGRLADPKAVVKLVHSCQWGAVAAVVTGRKHQIRVYNTANGKEWVHNYTAGGLAPPAYSADALCDE